MIIDLHSHTLPRSPCSSLRPAELVERVKQLGLDGVCITEHNETWPQELINRLREEFGFLVLRGMEVGTSAGHVLVYGLDRYQSGMWDVKKLRQVVDSAGAVMFLAHPLRDVLYHVSHEEMPLLFDGLEVLNGTESIQNNSTVLAISKQLGLKGVGGSDAHTIREVGTCATEFEGDIRNEADLVEALKANGYKPQQLR